jgi:hypothetical protein
MGDFLDGETARAVTNCCRAHRSVADDLSLKNKDEPLGD